MTHGTDKRAEETARPGVGAGKQQGALRKGRPEASGEDRNEERKDG